MKITSLTSYPLTGAQGIECDGLVLTPGGFVGDHLFVAYDPNTNERVSQKQLPDLAQITAEYCGDAALRLSHEDANPRTVTCVEGPSTLYVSEFGDATPSIDAGDEAAAFLSDVTGRSLRLAQKTRAWTEGYGIPPTDRANAPLHIITDASVQALQDVDDTLDFDADRFRASMRLSGGRAFEENQWVGRRLRVGDAVARITRLTPRCPVPGRDPKTGINLKDVPKLYPTLARAGNGKPAFGVYAVPILEPGQRVTISKTSPVELID